MRPYDQDDDEALSNEPPRLGDEIVMGNRVFASLKDALAYAIQLQRQQHRPDTVDGVISPDSRPPRDWKGEFDELVRTFHTR